MFSRFFKKKPPENLNNAPSIMGLRLGGSFEIDPLLLRLIEADLIVANVASTHIIQAAGIAELDGTTVFRFYSDDEAFLQIIAEGGHSDQHVVDVKLFHFYDTQDIANQTTWDDLLARKIGRSHYQLESQNYQRVWTSTSDYHNPVAMTEKTYDADNSFSETDQFTMLFERPISDNLTESLFLSAEESLQSGHLQRCLVISTGITLTPSQLTIHG